MVTRKGNPVPLGGDRMGAENDGEERLRQGKRRGAVRRNRARGSPRDAANIVSLVDQARETAS